MLVHLCDTAPIWRPENSVNKKVIWNLLWLSRQLIICNEQTNIYISTFPSDLTSKKAKTHEMGIYFSTNVIVALYCHNCEIQNTPVFKQSTLLSCNIVNRYKFTPSYA